MLYEQIDRITAPTLIIVGDQDAATPPDEARRIQERIPNAALIVIPGAGHTSTVEAPEAVTMVIKRFLEAQARRGAQS